ncbi:hypothetical protein [Allocoleopsis sp.]|uniref:hypothetical protein n=1 Tax=Allocoleopsis sp. TaxID=3088169 RepID=UPI002FD17BA1
MSSRTIRGGDRCVAQLIPHRSGLGSHFSTAPLHRLLPQASNVAEKVGSVATKTPLFKDERVGRFANDFKEIEDILEEAVRKVDPSKVSSEVFHNINFCDRKGMMPKDLCDSLHKVRQIRALPDES